MVGGNFFKFKEILCRYRFSTDDELNYETKEWLMDSQNYVIFIGIVNSIEIQIQIKTGAVQMQIKMKIML